MVLAACATAPQQREWRTISIALSDKKISLSAPPGSINDTERAYVDLATNTKKDILLFRRAWIASGMFSDSGAVDVKLLLVRFENRDPNQPFLEAVKADKLKTWRRVYPDIELVNFTTKNIGGRDWDCFVVTMVGLPDCAIEVDNNHYVIWRNSWISNLGGDPRTELGKVAAQVEKSIEMSDREHR